LSIQDVQGLYLTRLGLPGIQIFQFLGTSAFTASGGASASVATAACQCHHGRQRQRCELCCSLFHSFLLSFSVDPSCSTINRQHLFYKKSINKRICLCFIAHASDN